MPGNNQCIHHWHVDSNNVGCCVNCGAVKDFGALLSKQHGDLCLGRRQRGIERSPKRRGRQKMERREEIVKLREAGLTYTEIGCRCGISKERVRQILKGKQPSEVIDGAGEGKEDSRGD